MEDRKETNSINEYGYKSEKNISYEKVGNYEQNSADKQASKLSEITKAITKKDKG